MDTIQKIDLFTGSTPVKLTFSYGDVKEFLFTVVCIDAAGQSGWGEVVVPPTGLFKKALTRMIGGDPLRLDALLSDGYGDERSLDDHNYVLREALSIALHDLVGRIKGLPIHVLLGCSVRQRVPLMPCLFPTDADDAARKAEHFAGLGYSHFKVKLIGDIGEDVARVQAIRNTIGDEPYLQSDVNHGYSDLPTVSDAIVKLAEVGLNTIEDPAKLNTNEYSSLRAISTVRIMVDEYARRTDSLLDVLQNSAADIVSLHPDNQGGLSDSLRRRDLCNACGTPVSVGGTGFLGIGTAAYQQIASLAGFVGPCGELGGPVDHGMPLNLVPDPLPVENGHVSMIDSPGLGIAPDMSVLERLSRNHTEIS